jgi:hypothetical protein
VVEEMDVEVEVTFCPCTCIAYHDVQFDAWKFQNTDKQEQEDGSKIYT